jgi:hypothetical protein
MYVTKHADFHVENDKWEEGREEDILERRFANEMDAIVIYAVYKMYLMW